MRAPLLLAVAASVTVVVAAPFVGEIRGAVQRALPGQYVTIIGAAVAVAVAVAMFAAVARIRDRRSLRYGLLVAALAIGVAYARATASGVAEVDAVERFHFVEYGLLAILYYEVWRNREDLSSLALPVVAGILVGVLDESVQWFIPARVGEMRDVLLNGIALVCGLLFAVGLNTPRQFSALRDTGSRASLAALSVVTVAAAALFFHTVHLGHEVRLDVPAPTAFLSRFAAGDLAAVSRDRAARWNAPLHVKGGFTREDQYLGEALWHVQRRNEAVTAGDMRTAWHEDLILEAFYAPVLRVVPAMRWPAGQRAEAEARATGDARPYRSDANPYPIYQWSPALFWSAVAPVIVAIALFGFRPRTAGHSGAGQLT